MTPIMTPSSYHLEVVRNKCTCRAYHWFTAFIGINVELYNYNDAVDLSLCTKMKLFCCALKSFQVAGDGVAGKELPSIVGMAPSSYSAWKN